MRSELILFALVLTWATPTLAVHRQLETVGRTYPIVEPNILEELRQKATGIDVDALRDKHDRYQPSNLHKLPRAAADRMFTVDMTYTLDHDIKDEQERLLYPHGFTIKPLQYATLTGGLVVVDGSDPQQVDWFKASPYFQNHRVILLLSDGYAPKLKTELQRSVYYLTYDIADRLHLKAVPSVVIEQDRTVTVREVRLEEKR